MRPARQAPSWLGFVAAILFLATASSQAAAHDLRGTAVFVDVGERQVRLEAQIPLEQLGLAVDKPLAQHPERVLPAESEFLQAHLQDHLRVTAPDGRAFAVSAPSLTLQHVADGDTLLAQVALDAPAGVSARAFTLAYDAVVHKVVTHNVYVFVRHDLQSGLLGDNPELVGFLHFQNKRLLIDRSGGSWWRGFKSVFVLGTHHIAEGTDHLLFLLMLLLPAPLVAARRRWAEAGGAARAVRTTVKIVSAFTVGHSLTLLLGALAGAQLAEKPVEVLIAVSILVSALHALRPLFAGWEVLVAGGFGLVHGLAFASVLLRFGFDRSTLWLSVLGFNLGVEAMQLAVVALTMPWLVLLGRSRSYPYLRICGAGLGVVAACGWIGQRAFGLQTPVPPAVEAVAAHAAWGVGALACVALAWSISARRSVHKSRQPLPRPHSLFVLPHAITE